MWIEGMVCGWGMNLDQRKWINLSLVSNFPFVNPLYRIETYKETIVGLNLCSRRGTAGRVYPLPLFYRQNGMSWDESLLRLHISSLYPKKTWRWRQYGLICIYKHWNDMGLTTSYSLKSLIIIQLFSIINYSLTEIEVKGNMCSFESEGCM